MHCLPRMEITWPHDLFCCWWYWCCEWSWREGFHPICSTWDFDSWNPSSASRRAFTWKRSFRTRNYRKPTWSRPTAQCGGIYSCSASGISNETSSLGFSLFWAFPCIRCAGESSDEVWQILGKRQRFNWWKGIGSEWHLRPAYLPGFHSLKHCTSSPTLWSTSPGEYGHESLHHVINCLNGTPLLIGNATNFSSAICCKIEEHNFF